MILKRLTPNFNLIAKINMKLDDKKMPDNDSNQFVRVFELLNSVTPVSVGLVASAIENDGIYTWDRFGRFCKAKEPDVSYILDVLAAYKRWVDDGLFDLEEERNINDFSGVSDLWYFGWEKLICPDFGSQKIKGPQFTLLPKPQLSESRETTNLLNIIGALRMLLVCKKRSRILKFSSEASLFKHLTEQFKNVDGVKYRTMEGKLKLARQRLSPISQFCDSKSCTCRLDEEVISDDTLNL